MNGARCRVWAIAAIFVIAPIACLRSTYFEPVDFVGEATPPAGTPVSVTHLAAEVDLLERHIEWYGSIVPKRPDVWGQARLMAHRFEFEDQMKQELSKFDSILSASISRSDSAFLATAFSLGIATAAPSAKAGSAEVKGGTININTSTQSETTINPVPVGSAIQLGKTDAAIEPNIFLNQKARYLNHLHELRRINEGDDNADSPGYSLNLVRIPVSILTGSHTGKGFGAELSVTASIPYDPELLPTTFRNLVIGDLVDLGTLPIAQFIGAMDVRAIGDLIQCLDDKISEPATTANPMGSGKKSGSNPPETLPPAMKAPNSTQPQRQTEQANGGARRALSSQLKMTQIKEAIERQHGAGLERFLGSSAMMHVPSRHRVSQLPLAPSQIIEVFGYENVVRIIVGLNKSIANHLPNDETRREKGRVPFHLDIQGALTDELQAAFRFLDAAPELWDYCSDELAKAIRRRDAECVRMMREAFDDAVDAIRPPWKETVHKCLDSLWSECQIKPPCNACAKGRVAVEVDRYASDTITACLAWAVIVQSALLEERLVQDIKAVESARGIRLLPDGASCHFHGPAPAEETRRIFHEYVKARWPVYVFALDPVTDEQNVGERYTEVRDAQLAVAVAFATGQISGAAAMNYMRKLTRDIETIGLNRTLVGFAHGENNFGWRFYPRVQTPPFQGTLATVASLISPPDDKKQMNREARLENGQRECVAVMIMPSFVPHVDFEFASHWFHLNSPKVRKGTMKNAMRLSRHVQWLRSKAPHCSDAAMYRPGDIALLTTRLEQLSARLPLSQHRVNVPYENTAGGFELFNSGITDLGPELHGWYGTSGVDPNRTTTLFLVGENFSVHQTRLVVGGVGIDTRPVIEFRPRVNKQDNKITIEEAELVPAAELLSRQVMRVTIPPSAMSYTNFTNHLRVVDVHVATPYGVSRHLAIPVVSDVKAEKLPVEPKQKSCDSPGKPKPVPSGKASPFDGPWDRPSMVPPPPPKAVVPSSPAADARTMPPPKAVVPSSPAADARTMPPPREAAPLERTVPPLIKIEAPK